jgi:ferritin-like metal-binding protein YciE
MSVQTLHDLYLKELRDLYGAEKLLAKAVPKMIQRTQMAELRQMLNDHTTEIAEQLSRLEQVFDLHGQTPEIKKPRVLEGILREAEEDIADVGVGSLRDAAIVAAMQQIKHFEIAAYGTLQAYAIHLGYGEAAHILQSTLDEERRVDQKLTELALNRLKLEEVRVA